MVNIKYFPHEVDAFFDEKVLKLFSKHGFAGYGIFMRLLEILYSAREHRLPLEEEDFKIFCTMNHFPEEITGKVVNDFGLFKIHEGYFYSDRINRFILEYEDGAIKRSLAGQKAGYASAKARSKEPEVNPKSTAGQQKENKIKDNKVKYICTADATAVLEYFRDITGKQIRPKTPYNQKFVNARLNEGYSVADCKKVIRIKHKEWSVQEEMAKYVSVDILFGNKFEKYLNQDEKLEKTGIRRYMKDD